MMKAIVVLLMFALSCRASCPSGPVGECPEVDGETPTYLPDLKCTNCFYECSDGSPFLLNCTAGLTYVHSTHICDYPLVTREPCGPVGGCPAEGAALLRDGCNIFVYHECGEEGTQLKRCDQETFFNALEGACVPLQEAGI